MTNKASVTISAEDRFSQTINLAKARFDGLQQSLNKVTSVTGGFNLGIASIATTLVSGGVIGGLQSLVGSLDDLEESAQSVGVGAVALSELRTAARLSGVEAGTLDQALTKLNVKLAEAAGGSKEAQEIFAALGVSFKDANGNVRGTEDALKDVAVKFAGYADGAEKSALAVELFGRAGAKLVPMLNEGADGLRKFSGLTQETVDASKKLQGEFDKLSVSAETFKNKVLGAVVPAVNNLVDLGRRIDFSEFGKNFLISPIAAVLALDTRIKAAKREIQDFDETLKESLRLASSPLATSGKSRAPVLDKSTKENKKQEISDASRELASFVDNLQRQIEKTEELTNVERALSLLRANPSLDVPNIKEFVIQQAKLSDEINEEAKAREIVAQIIRKQIEEETRLRDTVLELSGVAEENRKRVLTEQLEILIAQSNAQRDATGEPILTEKQIEKAVKGIAGIKDEIAKTNKFAEQMGDSIAGAFEDAIVSGGRFQDVLKRLAEDIFRLIIRQNITGPLQGAIQGAFSSVGASSSASSKSLSGPNRVSASGQGTTVVYNISQIGSGVTRADVVSAMETTRQATIAQISDMQSRGRLSG